MGPTAVATSSQDNSVGSKPPICRCVANVPYGDTDEENPSEDIIVPNDQADEENRDSKKNYSSSIVASITDTISYRNITELNLSQQGLTSFPDTEDLSTLLTLNISHNEITELPPGLKSARHLRVLNASHNKISEFPHVLTSGLAMLKVINLSFNALNFFPKPTCVQHLEDLIVRSCSLQNFPKWILYERHCLETLDLSLNPIFQGFTLDKSVLLNSSCRILKKLKLSNTLFSDTFRDLFMAFSGLKHLDISNYDSKFHNRLMAFKEMLPPSLKVLKCSNLGMGCCPSLEDCSQIETVSLSNNPFHWINDDFPAESLRLVILTHCYICALPNNIGDMINLEYLDLSFNDVSSLPESFAKLTRLKHLDLYGNSFDFFPPVLESLVELTCLDVCCNLFEPPSHPLGSGYPSYAELRCALRSTISMRRTKGMVLKKDEEVYSDRSFSPRRRHSYSSIDDCFDSDEEDPKVRTPNHVVVKFNSSTQDDDWDEVDPSDRPFFEAMSLPDRGLQNQQTWPDDWNVDEQFMKLLHLVPARVRNSPFFYHRIDKTSVLNRSHNSGNKMGDVVEGQFDD